MEIEFAGAAREVTGSCHILRINGQTVLLDCGMFQGRRGETRAKNATRCPIEIRRDRRRRALARAHRSFRAAAVPHARTAIANPIYCTAATRDLCAVMLADSAHIQEKDAEFLARRNKERGGSAVRYAGRDDGTSDRMVGLPYDTTFDVVPGMRGDLHRCRTHPRVRIRRRSTAPRRARGSASCSRATSAAQGLPIIRDPKPPRPAPTSCCSSPPTAIATTRRSPARAMSWRESSPRPRRAAAASSIPAFSVGRTQELVYDLHVLAREGKIPEIPIYIDSPLAIDATTVFAMHPEIFDQTEDLVAEGAGACSSSRSCGTRVKRVSPRRSTRSTARW